MKKGEYCADAFFRASLMHWNEHDNKRRMPWKGEKDPYKIWLSEIILQQTRVEQGMAYYEKFIRQYPTVARLAAAADEQVFRLWQGLGYYNRCKNMLAAARQVVAEYQGAFPDTYEALLNLKGIGAYTAAAIASFAYNQPHAVLDGNVYRLLSRFFGISTPIDSTEGKKYFHRLSQELLDRQQPARYNQAIMDFGAIVCKPQQPVCTACPLAAKCSAFLSQRVSGLPVKGKKKEVRSRYFHYWLLKYRDRFYIRQRTDKDIWQQLHEFYLVEAGKELSAKALQEQPVVRSLLRGTAATWHSPVAYRHQLTHQTLHTLFFPITLLHAPKSLEDYKLLSLQQLQDHALPRLLEKYVQEHLLKTIPAK